ncbi:MAG: hypothetical protein HWE25_03485 [Alphaproteobacteria bacterium]|nr:hypothetical protein [Alphaproteobacteria bacterium]
MRALILVLLTALISSCSVLARGADNYADLPSFPNKSCFDEFSSINNEPLCADVRKFVVEHIEVERIDWELILYALEDIESRYDGFSRSDDLRFIMSDITQRATIAGMPLYAKVVLKNISAKSDQDSRFSTLIDFSILVLQQRLGEIADAELEIDVLKDIAVAEDRPFLLELLLHSLLHQSVLSAQQKSGEIEDFGWQQICAEVANKAQKDAFAPMCFYPVLLAKDIGFPDKSRAAKLLHTLTCGQGKVLVCRSLDYILKPYNIGEN